MGRAPINKGRVITVEGRGAKICKKMSLIEMESWNSKDGAGIYFRFVHLPYLTPHILDQIHSSSMMNK